MPRELNFTDPQHCVYAKVRFVTRAVLNRHDSEIRALGWRATQVATVLAMQERPAWSVAELADTLSVDRTTLLRTLRPLNRQGWIVRRDGERHRRATYSVAKRGVERLERVLPRWERLQRSVADLLGIERWMALLADLRKVARALEASASSKATQSPSVHIHYHPQTPSSS